METEKERYLVMATILVWEELLHNDSVDTIHLEHEGTPD
jgi:hypothetical protein